MQIISGSSCQAQLCPLATRVTRLRCRGTAPLTFAAGSASRQVRLGSRFLGQGPGQHGCAGCIGLQSPHRRAGRPSQQRRHLQRVQASFFGVGAPEAVLVAVVALIVFGPKGLAQAVKSLGSTFRTISPSIRELVTASTDLRSSFEEQIGLDEIRREFRGDYSRPVARTGSDDSNPSTSSASGADDSPASQAAAHAASASSNGATSASSSTNSNGATDSGTAWQDRQQDGQGVSTDFDVDIEAKRREAAQLAWGASTGQTSPAANGKEKEEAAPAKSALSDMSLEALEAELARRKAAEASSS